MLRREREWSTKVHSPAIQLLQWLRIEMREKNGNGPSLMTVWWTRSKLPFVYKLPIQREKCYESYFDYTIHYLIAIFCVSILHDFTATNRLRPRLTVLNSINLRNKLKEIVEIIWRQLQQMFAIHLFQNKY